ncbi:MAG: hypothetical protein KDE50_08575, partial [Caldilineaceae bacterium]|nr:hypothetical protein [Caldilineaceae bacterium]
ESTVATWTNDFLSKISMCDSGIATIGLPFRSVKYSVKDDVIYNRLLRVRLFAYSSYHPTDVGERKIIRVQDCTASALAVRGARDSLIE